MKRQIIWFNPPFNLKIKIKIGKLFLNPLEKHFPSHNKLHKLFNRNTVKISYSCMPNMNPYTYILNCKVQANIDFNIAGYKHVTQHLKIVPGIIKSG